MRLDKLFMRSVSKNGIHGNLRAKGAVYLTVTKGFNEKSNQIAIEVQHETGVGAFKTVVKHESALINVTFDDGRVWSGDFNKLKNILL